MKAWNRILPLLVLLCLLVGLLPSVAFAATEVASGTCGDNLTWVLDNDGTLTISGTGEMTSSPWTTDYAEQVKTVVIGDEVTSICESAFRECASLTSVTIPNGVTTIGDFAFECCYSLTSVTIPDGVTSIGYFTFSDCTSLASIIIPTSVTQIGDFAFSSCTSLTSVTIPTSVTCISTCAFGYCTSLTKITFEGDAPEFASGDDEYGVFSRDTTTAYYPAGNETWTEDVMQNYGGTITWVAYSKTEPATEPTTKVVASGVCGDNLTWVLDNDGTLTISGTGRMTSSPWTTDYAEQIKTVVIEDGATSICEMAFVNCTSLASITIPGSVTSIDDAAFYNCTSLTSVTIPNGVTSIADGMFYNCTSLTSVTIPNGVTEIGANVFASCGSLTSMTIPSGVTYIGDHAFSYCSSLTSMTIPNSVTYIGFNFFYCTSLNTVVFEGNAPEIGTSAFYGITVIAYYPAGNETWTEDVMQNYGGTITWTPCSAEDLC